MKWVKWSEFSPSSAQQHTACTCLRSLGSTINPWQTTVRRLLLQYPYTLSHFSVLARVLGEWACGVCHEVIGEQCLAAFGKYYHKSCFKCSNCRKPIVVMKTYSSANIWCMWIGQLRNHSRLSFVNFFLHPYVKGKRCVEKNDLPFCLECGVTVCASCAKHITKDGIQVRKRRIEIALEVGVRNVNK